MDITNEIKHFGLGELITMAIIGYAGLTIFMSIGGFIFEYIGDIIYYIFVIIMLIFIISYLSRLVDNGIRRYKEMDGKQKGELINWIVGIIAAMYMFAHVILVINGDFWHIENQVIAYFKYDFPAIPDFIFMILDVIRWIIEVIKP